MESIQSATYAVGIAIFSPSFDIIGHLFDMAITLILGATRISVQLEKVLSRASGLPGKTQDQRMNWGVQHVWTYCCFSKILGFGGGLKADPSDRAVLSDGVLVLYLV